MADFSHLEKMGRELKCPICLSLLNSAASLGCNHVFCNTCIEKSMKSGSNCPVCKVPYRRREVRPAPHMDNLVTIYKSMEVASGINIFVTQNLPPAKLSDDGDKQVEGDGNCSKCLDAETSKAAKQRTSKKGQQKIKKSSQKSSASSPVKPSFPRKKRVQVPQCPLSETPTRHAKLASIYNKMNDEELRKNAVVLGDKGEPVLSPFFWLKGDEEDDEKSSQRFDWDQPTDSMTVNVPSFSDIKDSLDETPFKTPMEEVCGKSSSDLDLFDSEMFEWTQRPCSPELCSSPFKRQVEDRATIDSTETTILEAASNKEPEKEYPNENSDQSGGIPGLVVPDVSPQETNNMKNQKGSKKLKKRGRKKKEIALKKCASRCTESALENSVKKNECMIQKQECEASNRDSLKTYTKRSKRAHSGINTITETLEDVCAVPIRLETSIVGPENFGTETSAFPEVEKVSEFPEKRCKKSRVHKAVDGHNRSKKRKLDLVGNKLLEEQSFNQNPTNNCAVPNLATSTSAIALSISQKKGDVKQPKSSSFGCITFNEYDDIIQETRVDAQVKHNQLNGKLQCNTDAMLNKVHLPNCERLDNEFRCAFCRSSKESEASGRMVHYFNGKPIDAKESNEVKNSRVVHAHWNCVEWAPNVFFDGDLAKNLEAELNRSRRIKCSCCGIKGAALGCYEKSCRKSFHVPCAKLMPQCQWDTNNFVMLCPLHPDSKLPIQDMGHRERKKKCTSKRQPCAKHIAVDPEISNNGNFRFRESPKKIVLCTSALTMAEKEAVLDFQGLSGVTMLLKWDDSVTHIIASTDENGACKRTLKILMGILKGKWILSIEWIKACKQAMEAVEEESYEITLDVHGIRDGPRLGRLRVLNNQPKLFAGFSFFFTAAFTPSYKGYLQELVTAAGGSVLLRKPVSSNQNTPFSSSSNCRVLIIYSLELPDNCVPGEKNKILNRRRSDAKLLAHSASAKVATNSWLLNSIAGSKLESLAE